MKFFTLRNLSYATAVALVAFSGSVSVAGLAKFAPGSVAIVVTMGALFELSKLAAFTHIGRKGVSRPVKIVLGTLGSILVVLNIIGMSGQLSNSYTQRQLSSQAAGHVATATAYASADLIERQLAQSETNLAQARQALVRARDDKARQRGAQAIITSAMVERDALVRQLADARSTKAQAEGEQISAAGEFAAVAYVSSLTGWSMDRVTQLFILVVSCLPDLLAITLLIAAGHAATHGGAREGAGRPKIQDDLKSKPKIKAKAKRRPAPANLKVINAQ
jgi:hypothetical protein